MNVYEADIIKGFMESAGIPARLSYESLEMLGIPLRASLSSVPAGIRIQVPEDRVEEAKSLLEATSGAGGERTCRIKYKGKFSYIPGKKKIFFKS